MFFVSFQWPWHPRHYINSWNEAIYLMNMSVSNVYAPAPGELSARLTPEQKWAPPLVVMSAKLNAWPGVNLSNFTHRGTKNGRSCQSIWKIFYLWNWILRQWGQPPVDETGSLETKLAMLPQSPCAAEHTITHWWLAIPIRAAHQDSVLICKMTKQNHQSPNLWRTPKHGCHTPRLTPSLPLQAPNCPTEPLPAIQLSGTGEGKKKRKPAASASQTEPDTVNGELNRFSPPLTLPEHDFWACSHPCKCPLLSGFCSSCLSFCLWMDRGGGGAVPTPLRKSSIDLRMETTNYCTLTPFIVFKQLYCILKSSSFQICL